MYFKYNWLSSIAMRIMCMTVWLLTPYVWRYWSVAVEVFSACTNSIVKWAYVSMAITFAVLSVSSVITGVGWCTRLLGVYVQYVAFTGVMSTQYAAVGA